MSQCCSRRCRSTRCTARCCTTPTRTPFGERSRYHPSARVPLLPHAHCGAPAGQGPGLRAHMVVVERVGDACSAASGFLPSCFPLARMSSSISRALPVPLNPKPLNPKPLRNLTLFAFGRAEWAHPRRMRANRGHARCLRVPGQRASLSVPGWIFSCPRVRVAFSWTVRVRGVPKAGCSAGSCQQPDQV